MVAAAPPLEETPPEVSFALAQSLVESDAPSSDGDPPPAPPRTAAKIPPEVQTHIDAIQTGGMLGQLPQPLPLALLGIGGDDAFIRTANGQTGLLRVGEELGGVKLLRIDINQVVVEMEGQERTLELFPGLGR